MKYYNKKNMRNKRVNKKKLICSVDIGMKTNYGYYRFPNGDDISSFKFENTREGFRKFDSLVSNAIKLQDLDGAIVGYESTGIYSEPFAHFIYKKENMKLVQVNPVHSKRLKELTDNSPLKTDKKDPRVIADIIELGHSLSVIIPEGVSADLRNLTHARERQIKFRTQYLNTLHSLVYKIFPEFIKIMKGFRSKTSQYLLNNYLDPKDLVKENFEKLKLEINNISRGKITERRLQKLVESAANTIGITEGLEGLKIEMSMILRQIRQINADIEQLEEKIRTNVKKIKWAKYMLSMKGIGEPTVGGLIGEIGDIKKFKRYAELEKLAGLNLFETSSGRHKGRMRISKRGRTLMRKILFFAALSTVRKSGIHHEYYQKKIENGMIKMKALISVSKKILKILFALARDEALYDNNYMKEREAVIKIA